MCLKKHTGDQVPSTFESYWRTPVAPMRPLYDARIEDVGPGDFLHVACGHDLLIRRSACYRAGGCRRTRACSLASRANLALAALVVIVPAKARSRASSRR